MDDTEAIASRLHKFIQAAKRKASASTRLHKFIQMARPAPARSTKRKAEILKIYEECLSKLTDEELAEVDRIIRKMSGAFGDPSGATPPPWGVSAERWRVRPGMAASGLGRMPRGPVVNIEQMGKGWST